ncbi:MAG: TonB-dependent receptor [Halioglobus sp.]
MRRTLISVAITALVASSPLNVAFAAELEEVLVTATKRGEFNVQDLAEAVYAVDSSSLRAKNQLDFEDIAGSIPGLQFQDLGPGDKEFIIRGINGNGPAVVGAYFDEYVITASDQQDGGGKNAPIKLIDLERVEVLNGPQGTLYGANSMAGNLRYISNKADTGEFDAFVSGDISETDEGGSNYNVSGMINIPLVDDVLAARLVGWYTDNDGWVDQPRREIAPEQYGGNDEDINTEETDGFRLGIRWTPNDRWLFDGVAMFQNMEIGGESRFTAKGTPAWTQQTPEIAEFGFSYAELPGLPEITTDDDFINTNITGTPRDDDVTLIGGTLQYTADYGTFSLASSYYEHEVDATFDSTPILAFFGVPTAGVTSQPQTFETTMIEARFASNYDSPFNFVAGVYYQEDENEFESLVTTTDGQGNAVPWDELNSNDFFGGGTAFFGRFREDTVEQQAVFGEATYEFTDNLRLLVGLRWFDADIESVQATTHAFGGQPSEVAGEIIGKTLNGNDIGLLKQSDDTIVPKISLSYDVSDDVMIYGLYSEGFRVGGINNGNQPFAPGIPNTFESDELQNYEAGFKSRFMDDSFQLNTSLFWIDWEDIQVEPRDPAGNIPFTTNGGAAEIGGVEWSVAYLPFDILRLDFTGTYYFTHELSEDQPVLPGASDAVITGLSGDEIPNVPDMQLYFAATYNAEVAGMPLNLIADVTYRDESNTEFRDSSPFNFTLDSYTLVNVFFNLEVTDSVTVGLYAKNVTNELAVQDGIATFQDPQAIVAARPRTYGATLRWHL